MDANQYVAIDPVALVLHGRALDMYYEIHHPHVPSIEVLQQALQSATPEERKATIARAKTLVDCGTAVVKAIESMPVKTR